MNSTKELQTVILNIYKEFQRVCDKNNLKYYALFGTCIGAVRHHGFIPWDDDLDVAMPLEDYMRFRELAPLELNEPYAVYGTENKHWEGPCIKVHNKNTTFLEAHMENYPDRYVGVFIDIFPLCGMAKTRLSQKIESYFCDLAQTLNIRQRRSFAAEDSLIKKLFWIINLPVKLFAPYYFYTDMIEAHFKKRSFDNSDRVICLGSASIKWAHKGANKHSMFSYEDFKSTISIPFEDGTIPVMCGYDRYLSTVYGDYMTPPPAEERVAKHAAEIIDLNKPCAEYRIERFGK